jgi:hypothetical protein
MKRVDNTGENPLNLHWKYMAMNRVPWSLLIIVIGVLIAIAGFIPFTQTTIVTTETVMEKTEYREEVKTREEVYTEEKIVGEEEREEPLWKETITAHKASTAGREFELKRGDTILFAAHSENDIMISFTGQGHVYMSMEVGTDIEKEFSIKADGTHTLLYSPASVKEDAVIAFHIVRITLEPITESVEKTRTVEYTERIPYTVEVPITEQIPREDRYTITPLRYCGMGIIIIGGILFVWRTQSDSAEKSRSPIKKSVKK